MAGLEVYHGADRVVERPACGAGAPYRDFGVGFYCTTQRELAEVWACEGLRGGFVSRYVLDTDALQILDLTAETIGPFHWLGLLAAHRRFLDAAPTASNGAAWFRANACPALDGWDAVLGWRGDSSQFSFAQAVFSDNAPMDRLYRALAQSGTQLVLRTPRALAALRFQSCAAADPFQISGRGRARDRAARAAFWPEAVRETAAGRAYDALYLTEAMGHLGEALDYAVHGCGLGLDAFLALWTASGQAARFAAGAPSELCRPGVEQVVRTLEHAGTDAAPPPALKGPRRTPEFWCGQTLAYYQWYTGCGFAGILRRLPASALLEQAAALETLEGPSLAAALEHLSRRNAPVTALQSLRRAAGLSQRELAARAGVSLRMIQQYEQRAKEINRASGTALRALSRALDCTMEDLLEPNGVGER